jgi:hypothetical protein
MRFRAGKHPCAAAAQEAGSRRALGLAHRGGGPVRPGLHLHIDPPEAVAALRRAHEDSR